MKKTLLLAFALAVFISGRSQNGNNICVFNALNNYSTGGGTSELERGMKCSDEAIVNESTANDKKTWFYRGELYTQVATDSVLNKRYGKASFDAIAAFKKLDDLNDPKFKDWDEVWKYMIPLERFIFNQGVDEFKNKNYAMAYKYFYLVKDADAVFVHRKNKPPVELATALKNAALSAENANDTIDAIKVYQDWLAIAPNAYAYAQYAKGLLKTGDTLKANKIVDEGLSKYPDDANLLGAKITSFLEAKDFSGAIGYLHKFLVLSPDNDKALCAMARSYGSMNKEDSATYYYTKAHEVNPKNTEALTQIGDMYLSQANALNDEITKLGNSPEDTKKANELDAKKKALFLKAKPYFEDAKKLEPNDPEVNRILNRINALTGEGTK